VRGIASRSAWTRRRGTPFGDPTGADSGSAPSSPPPLATRGTPRQPEPAPPVPHSQAPVFPRFCDWVFSKGRSWPAPPIASRVGHLRARRVKHANLTFTPVTPTFGWQTTHVAIVPPSITARVASGACNQPGPVGHEGCAGRLAPIRSRGLQRDASHGAPFRRRGQRGLHQDLAAAANFPHKSQRRSAVRLVVPGGRERPPHSRFHRPWRGPSSPPARPLLHGLPVGGITKRMPRRRVRCRPRWRCRARLRASTRRPARPRSALTSSAVAILPGSGP